MRATRLIPLLVLTFVGCRPGEPGLLLVGTVERTLIELVAPVSEVIIEIPVARGDHVEAGDLLVRLDGTLAEAEVARTEAELVGASKGVVVADHELKRLRQLHGANVASEQALERAQLDLAEATSRLREAQARHGAAYKRRSDLDLVAPVSGTVDQLPFDPGERVPAGAVLAVLLADGEPWVRVWIPERAFAQVAPGTPAEVRIDGVAAPLSASVLDVAREPEFTPHYALTERDRVHLVYEARVGLHGAPAALRPGMPAQVRIATEDGPLAVER